MLHYSDDEGFKAIASQTTWRFKAFGPRGPHPDGAYFTTLAPTIHNLAARLRVPKNKLEWLFDFIRDDRLIPIDGGKGRGEYIFYCPTDYDVEKNRQLYKGLASHHMPETFP